LNGLAAGLSLRKGSTGTTVATGLTCDEDHDAEHVFQPNGPQFTWRVPMSRANDSAYTYKVTWLKTHGQPATTGPVRMQDEILPLDPLAP
jgi:hypothetical protein